MSYIDKLWEKHVQIEQGKQMDTGVYFVIKMVNKEVFKQALTEALEKQRELVINWFDEYMHTAIEAAFNDNKLEDL